MIASDRGQPTAFSECMAPFNEDADCPPPGVVSVTDQEARSQALRLTAWQPRDSHTVPLEEDPPLEGRAEVARQEHDHD